MHNPPFRLARTASMLALALTLAACGDNPEKLIAAARDHLEKNDPAAASIELKNALAKDPNLAEARFLLGDRPGPSSRIKKLRGVLGREEHQLVAAEMASYL